MDETMRNSAKPAQPKPVNIAKFLDYEGKVIHIPAKARTLLPVLQYAAAAFESGVSYNEKEINALLQGVCVVDYMSVRRLLIDQGYLMRTPSGSAYWKGEHIPSCWRLPENSGAGLKTNGLKADTEKEG